jgi:ABC-2 type transport system ATP-binding protein
MINIEHLSFGYKKKKPLYRDLSVSLRSGSIYGLLGKNGAGKSTLLKNLTGLLFPTHGHISVNGYEPRKRTPAFLETVYFIPEEVYVPSLTIKSYIALYSPFYTKFDIGACLEYLKVLNVETGDKLTTLSFGQQKKFIVAFGLACNTPVLLLDEPTNGLDIPSKVQFRRLISSAFTEERMIFISTHQIRDLDSLIDSVIIVDKGELLLSTSVGEVAKRLLFTRMKEMPADAGDILYSEDSLQGISVVKTNPEQEDSKVNLEHLFNAVIENPLKIKELFK